MGWLEDLGNAAASTLSAAGDLVEAVVETVTETAQSGVDAVEDVVDNVGTGVRDWVSANTNPIVTGLVNVGFGVGGGLLEFGFDAVGIGLELTGDVGHLAADGLRLNLPKVIADLANLGIGAGEAAAAAGRLVTGGYFAGATIANVDRDRGLAFIRRLVLDEFGDKRGAEILDRLGFGSVQVGLRLPVDYRVLRMDSATYPLAADHAAGVFDLFALAGVLSGDSFRIAQERTRVVIVDTDGSELWYVPVGRSVIQSFLDTGSPRLRVYAWQNYAASRAMRFARQKLRNMFILVDFGPIETLSRFQAVDVVDITSADEFRLHGLDRYYELGRFVAARTGQDGELADDFRVTALGVFGFSGGGTNGIAAGIRIRRSESADAACGPDDTSVECITEIRRTEADYGAADDPRNAFSGDPQTLCGRAVLHRDTFPPYFSKVVLAHELGHHLGLAHAGHDGVQNIMFTIEGQDILDGGLWRLWAQGEPDFQPRDLEDVWRFLVHRLPHVLGG